jgi:hypothetical protein
VGSYDAYAIPRQGYVAKVERQDRGLRLSADIEIVMPQRRRAAGLLAVEPQSA